MASAIDTDLPEFIEFAQAQLGSGHSDLTPEEVLDLWRARHPTSDDVAETVAAIQRAIAQADRGEGVSWEDFDRSFRTRHQIQADA